MEEISTFIQFYDSARLSCEQLFLKSFNIIDSVAQAQEKEQVLLKQISQNNLDIKKSNDKVQVKNQDSDSSQILKMIWEGNYLYIYI